MVINMFWKFVCTNKTEAECFQRRLFGDTRSLLNEVLKVKKGNVLFLYNLNSDVIFGPFIAESDGRENIEPDAWDGKFPSQVKVSWNIFSAVTNASKNFSFIRRKSLRITNEEAQKILKLLEKPTIGIPPEIKRSIQRLDEEIHSLAHRIEEVVMSGKGHPADRQIELDRLKGEFYSKMKDFVWAIRKLDKITGILNLPSNR